MSTDASPERLYRKTLTASLLICMMGASSLAIPAYAQFFQDYSELSGITAASNNNAVSVADFDQDGDLDIYFVAQPVFDPEDPSSWNYLLKNNGDGTFSDVTVQAGVEGIRVTGYTGLPGLRYGASWGDFDNDTFPDLYLTGDGPELLYHNLGNGTFEDVTLSAGVGGPDVVEDTDTQTSSLWWDYDNDGDLDLYVSSLDSPNRLFENHGDGTFSDVARAAGLNNTGLTWASIPVDVNQDGLQDLYVVNDFGANFFYVNHSGGVFTEETASFGLEDTGNGMGTTVGDVNNDGLFDIFLTNIASFELNPLFLNTGRNSFENVAVQAGVSDTEFAWGTELFDYDNDGDLDLYVVNGFLSIPMNNYFFASRFLDTGVVQFDDVSLNSGVNSGAEARGLVVFDYDGDGDLDIAVANRQTNASLYDNRSAVGNWISVALRGTRSNSDGLGAVITLVAGDLKLTRQNDGVDFLGQNIQPIHFGLGAASTVDSLTVRWPGGGTETFTNLQPNRIVWVTEDEGLATGKEPGAPTSTNINVSTWPNPFDTTFNVELVGAQPGPYRFNVYDLLGQLVFSARRTVTTGERPVSIDLTDFPVGSYFLRIVPASDPGRGASAAPWRNHVLIKAR